MEAIFESDLVRLIIDVKWALLSTTCSENCRCTENNVSKHEAVISTALDTASIPANYLLNVMHTTNTMTFIPLSLKFNPYSSVFIHWSPAIFSCLSLLCDDHLFIISLGRYPITPDHGGLSRSSSSRCRVLLSFPVAFYKSRRTELLNPQDWTMVACQGSHPTEGTTIHIFF